MSDATTPILPAEARAKAVAAAEAIYRLTAAGNFDAALRVLLRTRATGILSAITGLALRSGSGRRAEAERLRGEIAGLVELVAFAERMQLIRMEHGQRVRRAYAHVDVCVASAAPGNDSPETGGFSPGATELTQRQRRMLAHLGQSGRAQVGDFHDLFGGQVSEKTLQRELMQLVTSGFIRRSGDNRWTTYISIGHNVS